MKNEKWMIVYLNGEIYSSLCIFDNEVDEHKNRFLEEISNFGTVDFEFTDREPFHGW